MGIDAKTVKGFVCGIVKSSMSSCCSCLRKHPFLSSVVLVFFLLYLFIPSVFNVVIYTAPVIICIVASVKIYSRTQQSKIQYAKRVEENSPSVESKSLPLDHHSAVASRNDDKAVAHLSRRRNVKEWEAEGSKEEKEGMVSNSKATPNALNVLGNLAAVLDEKGNASSDQGESSNQNASIDRYVQADDDKEKESCGKDPGESSSRNASNSEDVQAPDQPTILLYSQPSMSDLISSDGQPIKYSIGGGGTEVVEVESSDDAEDEDEDGRQRDRHKAVEWTADDEQNLMDLGDSELERNKRLESLIARRRARKLFKMAMEKRGSDSESTSPGQIAPLSIVRNNLLDSPTNHEAIEDLQLPGSAPSVLLPSRNPFDIPYDSSEEKPNLMADSFNQEFSAAQFCRHESFCWGSSFSVDSHPDHLDSRFGPFAADKRIENLRFSKFRTQSDVSTHDQLIDDLLSQEGQALFRMLSARDLIGGGAPNQVRNSNLGEPKSGEDRESWNVTAGATGEKTSQDAESRSSVDRSEIQMETDSVRDNTSEPCSSEASELSFQGNVTTNVESNLEPKGGQFPQKLSDRVQNSLTFFVPEGAGFHGPSYDSSPSGVDRPRMEERLFYRDKLPCHSPVYSIASDLQVEVSDVGSPPLTIDGNISPADVESSYDGDVERDITSGSEEMWGASSHLLGVEENDSRSKEVNEISERDIIGMRFSAMKPNLQDPVLPSKLPAEVAEQAMSKTSPMASSGTEIPEKDKANSKNTDNKVPDNVKQVTEEVKRSKISDALPPKIPQKGVHSEKPEELANTSQKLATEAHNVDDQVVNANDAKISAKHLTSTDLPQPVEKITSESSKDVKNTFDKPPEHQTWDQGKQSNSEAAGETSETNAGQEDEKSVQECINEQNITGVGVSGVNQSSDIPILTTLQPILVAEQFSASSSSCSSPRSVLPGKIPKEQIPSSQFGQIHINVPPSVVDVTAINNSMNNELPGGLILTAPQNSLHLVVNPPNHSSTSSSSGISEGPLAGVIEGKSESLIQPAANIAQPERAHQSYPGSVDDTKGKSKAPPECSPSKPEEKTANSNVLATMVKEEETRNSLGQSTGEDNIIKKAKDPVLNEKEHDETLKSVIGSEEDASQHQKEKLTENEAVVGPSNSVDGNKSSSVIYDSENIKHIPKTDSSEGKLEASTEASRGESKTSEASTKPSTPPAGTSVKEAQSNPVPQKSSEKVDTKHNVKEIVANETSNKKSLVDKEKTPDHTKPGKAAAEVDNKQGEEKVANVMTDNKSLTDQENVAEKRRPGKSTAEVNAEHEANETDDNKMSNNTSSIDKGNAADKTKPDKAAAEVENKQGEEKVTNVMTNNKSLADQENVAEKRRPSDSTAEVETKHRANETDVNKISNNKNSIDQENAADKTKPDKHAAEVDLHNVNETAANETSNKKSLVEKEKTPDHTKPGKAAAEVDNKEGEEKVANVMTNNKSLTDQENVAEKRRPGESTAEVDTKYKANETDDNKISKNTSSIDQENAADTTKPDKVAAEVDNKQGEEEVANVMTNNKTLTDQENVAEKKRPGESTAEVDTKHKANGTDDNKMSNNTSLIYQENAADKTKPDKAAAEIGNKQGEEKVTNLLTNTKSLIDQENVAEKKRPGESTVEVNVKRKANETDDNKISKNTSSIDQENAADTTKPDKAAAEIGNKQGEEKVANLMTNNKSLIDQENVAEKKRPDKSTTEVDVKRKANETDDSKISKNTSSIYQENAADTTKPDKAAAYVDNKQGEEKVANLMTNNKSLTDQENVAEKKRPGESSEKVETKHKANETDDNKMSNNTSLIDQENAADKTKPDKAAAEVDILQNVNEKVANETSNTKKLVNQENVVDEQKPAKGSDSLKTSEDIKREPDDLKKDNVTKDKLPEHNITGEPSKPVESEVKSPQKETKTTV